MEILIDAAWRIAADVMLTAGLLKAGVLIAVLWLAVRAVPARYPDLRSFVWILGFGTLLVLPALSWHAPLMDVQLVEFPRGMFQEGSAGSPAFWLALIWAAGTVGFLARFTLHRIRVGRIAARAEEVTGGPLAGLLAEARARVPAGRSVRLAVSEAAPTPILVGSWRPVVLLPPDAREWPEERLLAVLCHELAHVRRRDYLWMVLGEVVRAVYWMNPLVFFGLKEVRIEQDKACDAAALRAGFPSTDYARHLVEVARSARRRVAPSAALSFGRRSDLRERVGVLLEGDGPSERPRTRRLLAAMVSVALVAVSAGALAATDFWICTGA